MRNEEKSIINNIYIMISIILFFSIFTPILKINNNELNILTLLFYSNTYLKIINILILMLILMSIILILFQQKLLSKKLISSTKQIFIYELLLLILIPPLLNIDAALLSRNKNISIYYFSIDYGILLILLALLMLIATYKSPHDNVLEKTEDELKQELGEVLGG